MATAVKIGYQGEPGAYSEAAAHAAFKTTGAEIDATGYASFDEVFEALTGGKVQYAVVPVENTLGGSIHVNYDLMLRHHGQVHVVGEHSFRVRHTLLALPGVKKSDIKRAMSHPQALAQTDRYLRAAGIQPVPAYDTAGSAKLVREQGLRDTAAIASARAAEVHGLEVVDFGIEDDANNFTRFLVIGLRGVAMPEGVAAKTSIVFVPKRNEVGVLHKAISCFAQRDIDLAKIESRPFRSGDLGLGEVGSLTAPVSESPAAKRPRLDQGSEPAAQFEYAFYLDVLASASAPACRNAFRHLEELTRFVKVLGTYPVEGLLFAPHANGEGAASPPPHGVLHSPLVSPLKIVIVGFGTFGQFLARRWVMRGHSVVAQSRTDYSEVASAMGAHYVSSLSQLSPGDVDILVVAVSILSFAKVATSRAPSFSPSVPPPPPSLSVSHFHCLVLRDDALEYTMPQTS